MGCPSMPDFESQDLDAFWQDAALGDKIADALRDAGIGTGLGAATSAGANTAAAAAAGAFIAS